MIAKAPIPGRVKTRLCPPCTPTEAAGLAEAALSDTLAAMRATPADRRIVVLDGQPDAWLGHGFEVIAQRGDGLAERLAGAFEDIGEPALVVGMDTPQVQPAALAEGLSALARTPAVLGAAHDGGYWSIGLRTPDRRVFEGIPMSSTSTGAAQRQRLADLGLDVTSITALADVDDIETARAVAASAPETAFARAFAAWARSGVRGMNAAPSAVYAQGLASPDPAYRLRLDTGEIRPVPFERWLGPVTRTDELVLERVVGPVLDVGCGPGRHVRALALRGVMALGVDASATAIELARRRGTAVFHGSVFDEVPGAGEWRSALLLDGNLGIGGSPERLLRRLGGLLRPGGTIIAEADAPGTPTGTVRVRLEGSDVVSRWFRWAQVGVDGMGGVAAQAGMRVVDSFAHDDRWFVVIEA